MAVDRWLPVGHQLPDEATVQDVIDAGPHWQIYSTRGGGRALVVRESLYRRWLDLELIAPGSLTTFLFGNRTLVSLSCGGNQTLTAVAEGNSPATKSEALSFAAALRATREIDSSSPLQDAIYVEKLSRLLPTFSISSEVDDHLLLGYWLTGGAHVSVHSYRRLRQMLSWLGPSHLRDVVEAAGLESQELTMPARQPRMTSDDNALARPLQLGSEGRSQAPPRRFQLPGRPNLESFFNEHVVEILRNRDRYEALGIGFPSPVVLHGPPGTGKTFAVEQLIEFLGWPSFNVAASSVASPYIHETSRKISQVFDAAVDAAPSVVVIDEMEAFLAERDAGPGQHRIEELAEFLRRIPEATANDVLVIAMTNRIDLVDEAILRRGRFDHVIRVDYATEEEVHSLLTALLRTLPTNPDVDASLLAQQLAGRPLSDVAFAVREAARIAVRREQDEVDQDSLMTAVEATTSRKADHRESPIGFV